MPSNESAHRKVDMLIWNRSYAQKGKSGGRKVKEVRCVQVQFKWMVSSVVPKSVYGVNSICQC